MILVLSLFYHFVFPPCADYKPPVCAGEVVQGGVAHGARGQSDGGLGIHVVDSFVFLIEPGLELRSLLDGENLCVARSDVGGGGDARGSLEGHNGDHKEQVNGQHV